MKLDLIERNKIPWEYKEYLDKTGRNSFIPTYGFIVARKEVDDMPEVDAIPVWFIENELRELKQNCERWINLGMGDIFSVRNFPIMEDTIKGLIYKWRQYGKQ